VSCPTTCWSASRPASPTNAGPSTASSSMWPASPPPPSSGS